MGREPERLQNGPPFLRHEPPASRSRTGPLRWPGQPAACRPCAIAAPARSAGRPRVHRTLRARKRAARVPRARATRTPATPPRSGPSACSPRTRRGSRRRRSVCGRGARRAGIRSQAPGSAAARRRGAAARRTFTRRRNFGRNVPRSVPRSYNSGLRRAGGRTWACEPQGSQPTRRRRRSGAAAGFPRRTTPRVHGRAREALLHRVESQGSWDLA